MATIMGVTRTSKAGITAGYTLDVRFENQGKSERATILVRQDLGERAWNEEGSNNIEIVYLPDDPTFLLPAKERERAWGHGNAVEPYGGFALAAFFAAIAFACLLRYRSLKRTQVRSEQ
jgi:hypothetical protein